MFRLRGRPRFSQGERSFISAFCGFGMLGAVLAWVSVLRLSEQNLLADGISPFAFWTIFAGVVGGFAGFVAGYGRWLGHEGVLGWMRAGIGVVMISLIGAVVAGTLILPYYGTMFGPFQVILVMIEIPALAAIWIAMVLSAHCMVAEWRRERDSIFADATRPRAV